MSPRDLRSCIESVVLIISIVILGSISLLLSILAVSFTGLIPLHVGEIAMDKVVMHSAFGVDAFPVFFVPLLLALVLLIVAYYLSFILDRVSIAYLVAAICVILLTVQVSVILLFSSDRPHPYADSLRLDFLARALVNGDNAAFCSIISGDTAPYLSWFPFQSGAVLFFAFMYRVFGLGNQMAVQIVSAIFNCISAVSILLICEEMWHKRSATRACFLLLVTCFPLVLSSLFVYGNAIGLGSSLLGVWTSLRAMNSKRSLVKRIMLVFASAASMAFALIIKSTNILILFGLIFGWAVFLLRSKSYALIPVMLIVVFCVQQAPSCSVTYLEKRVGSDFGEGMPKISWIAMGLRDTGISNVPGWWGTEAAEVYKETGGDLDAQKAAALQSIEASLSRFCAEPSYALYFFGKKLASEWADPTYMSTYYAGLYAGGYSSAQTPLGLTPLFTGFSSNRVLVEFMEAHQWIVYIASSLCFILFAFFKRERLVLIESPAPYYTVGFAIFAGFGCYLLWEAKGVYVFPFFMLMFPFAALLLGSVFDAVRSHSCRLEK